MSLPNLNENVSFKTITLLTVDGMESEDDAKKEISKMIRSCCDDGKVFDSLSKANVIYTLAQLRKESKGSKIEYNYNCQECKFDLNDEISIDKDMKTKKFNSEPIKIGSDLVFGIKEVPAIETDKLREKLKKNTEYNFSFIVKSIDTIAYKGEVYEEFSESEVSDFIDGMNPLDFETLATKINEAQAEVSIEKTLKCGKCKHVNEIYFGDLESFLAF